jgi:hypothetical protein
MAKSTWTSEVRFETPMSKPTRFAVGLDLGQTNDPSAVAIVQEIPAPLANGFCFDNKGREIPPSSGGLPTFAVRHLERLPLGTSYPGVIAHVSHLMMRLPLERRNCRLVLDRTGVGRPISDIFVQAGLDPIAVTITGGEGIGSRIDEDRSGYHVSRLALVSRLQALLHAGELKIVRSLSEADALANELMSFRASISEAGHTSFGARVGAHDDLVLALAIALWWLTRPVNHVTIREL